MKLNIFETKITKKNSLYFILSIKILFNMQT